MLNLASFLYVATAGGLSRGLRQGSNRTDSDRLSRSAPPLIYKTMPLKYKYPITLAIYKSVFYNNLVNTYISSRPKVSGFCEIKHRLSEIHGIRLLHVLTKPDALLHRKLQQINGVSIFQMIARLKYGGATLLRRGSGALHACATTPKPPPTRYFKDIRDSICLHKISKSYKIAVL